MASEAVDDRATQESSDTTSDDLQPATSEQPTDVESCDDTHRKNKTKSIERFTHRHLTAGINSASSSPGSTPTPTDSVPLVTVQGTHFQINENAIEMLRRIEKPVAVLSICGPYRSGKSYFLSSIINPDLAKKEFAFTVSNTSNPCTQGIWMATTALECEDFVLLLLDTEGTGAVRGNKTKVNKLVVLTILISSHLIFNMKGVPEQNHQNNMSFFANMSSNIIIQEKYTTDIKQFFPDFLWLIRDSDTELVDGAEEPISATSYVLTQILAPCEDSENEGPFQSITDIFPKIEGETIPPPGGNPKKDDSINPAFIEGINRVRNHLLDIAKPKCGFYSGTIVDGPLLADLLTSCVSVINCSGAIPVIDNWWLSSIHHHLQEESSKMLREYEEELKKHLKVKGTLPMEDGLPVLIDEELIDKLSQSPDSTHPTTLVGVHLQILRSKCDCLKKKINSLLPLPNAQHSVAPPDDVSSMTKRKAEHEEYVSKFLKQAAEYQTDEGGQVVEITGGILLKFAQENFRKSQSLCEATLTKVYRKFDSQSLKQHTMEQFVHDRKAIEEEYKSIAVGPAKLQVLNTLRSLLQEKEHSVKLSESIAKKEREINKMKEMINEQKKVIDDLHTQGMKHTEQIEKLQEELAFKKNEIEQLKTQIQKLQGELKEEETRRDQVKAELVKLKEDFDEKQRESQTSSERLKTEIHSIKESSEQRIQEVESMYQESDTKCNNLQTEIRQLSVELHQKENEKEVAEQKQRKLQDDLAILRRTSEQESVAVAAQISDLKDMNKELRKELEDQKRETQEKHKKAMELTPPNVPRDLKAYVNTAGITQVPNEVTVTWTIPEQNTADSESKILTYQVEMKEDGDNKPWQRVTIDEASIRTTTTTVKGLKYNTSYTFSVCAINNKGAISQAVTTNVKTGDKVPGPPRNVRYAARSCDMIKIAWNTPEENADAVVQYTIEYRQKKEEHFQEAGKCRSIQKTFLVKELNGYTSYCFRVAAINSSGDLSPYSNVLEAKTTYGTKRRILASVSAGILGIVPGFVTWSATAPEGDLTED